MPLQSPLLANQPRLEKAAQNSPPLKKNERGDAVARLQQALIECGFPMPKSTPSGTPDGIYGDETVQKVSAFQTREGLGRDGVVGQQTLNRLDALLLGQTDFPPGPVPPTKSSDFSATTARRASF